MKKLIILLFIAATLVSAQEYEALVNTGKASKYFVAPPPPPISEETEAEYLKALNSQIKSELLELKKVNKSRYSSLLMDAYFNSNRMVFPGLRKFDKEMLELQQKITEYEIRSETLALKYPKADKGDQSKIKSDLDKVLSELFEVKMAIKQKELDQLKKELDKLAKSIDVRSKNKNEIVKRRMQELLNEDDYLDWE